MHMADKCGRVLEQPAEQNNLNVQDRIRNKTDNELTRVFKCSCLLWTWKQSPQWLL